jgi:hypothetical protein
MVPVVIKSSSRSKVGRTIGYGIGFVNSGAGVDGALKPLEKPGTVWGMPVDAGQTGSYFAE